MANVNKPASIAVNVVWYAVALVDRIAAAVPYFGRLRSWMIGSFPAGDFTIWIVFWGLGLWLG